MKIKWFSTASVLIEAGDDQLLFDPFVPMRGAEHQVPAESFCDKKHILITHGHLDHLLSVKDIVKKDGTSLIYCTRKPYRTLRRKGVDKKRIKRISPDDELSYGNIKVRVLKSRHNEPDMKLFRETLFQKRSLEYFGNLLKMGWYNPGFREANQTVAYEVRAGGKSVLVLGSLGLHDGQEYPSGIDALILPYQGNIDNLPYAMEVVDRIQPKKVVLIHFDDSFPPITRNVDTESFANAAAVKYPGMTIIRPRHEEVIEV